MSGEVAIDGIVDEARVLGYGLGLVQWQDRELGSAGGRDSGRVGFCGGGCRDVFGFGKGHGCM